MIGGSTQANYTTYMTLHQSKLTYLHLTPEKARAELYNIKELGIAAYSQLFPLITPANAAIWEVNLANDATWHLLLDKVGAVFVCNDGDKMVGMAHLVPHGNPWDVFIADWCYLRMVGVLPGYRGCGIASTLTQMCLDYALKTGEQVMALHTSEAMHDARHIYEKMGFTILQEIPPRFGLKYWLYARQLH